ncbi:MAG TPA: cytochrome c biogenesis protein CcsA [Nitrospirales bacterium]|jgi:cytochrome c-type biogenesis protein CcsB|nr:cytochrome c biogenesis protein CcsA [Nitrospirales bacterium]
MNVLFFEVTLLFYFLGTTLFLVQLAGRWEGIWMPSFGVAGIGFFFHTLALVSRMIEGGHIPLTSMHEALSFFSWALVLFFLVVELRYRVHILGSFILPMAFISLISAAALPKEIRALEPIFRNVWMHVTFSLLGTVAFAVAFVAGLMYLIQEHMLKSKHLDGLYRKLPALDFLDELNGKAISFGFPLLTLGIITGALFAEFARGSFLNWNAEQIGALGTWLFYLIVLLGRVTVGWRAKKAAYLTVVGFAGVVFTLVGVILKGQHPFV